VVAGRNVVVPSAIAQNVGCAIIGLVLFAAAAAGAPARVAVWIDTDPALGEPDRDVDDGFALAQAFGSPELDIRGVSIVFGNAPLDRGLLIGRRLVRDFGPSGLRVTAGAAGPEALGLDTDASRALADALGQRPLTVLALGPATNVATVLRNHPDLTSRIVRIIAVAVRRPGQKFSTGAANSKGHRDFNFELDPAAFQVLLASGVPLVLAPFEISSKIWIEAADLDLLASGPPAAKSLVAPSRDWLSLWRRLFAVDGFNPFDTLAVGLAAAPNGFACETLPVEIQTLPDDVTEPGVQGIAAGDKPYLLVSRSFRSPARARYCSVAPHSFKRDLLARLMGVR
jgi:pyrimidine-specific ribonucleoside hydrolase